MYLYLYTYIHIKYIS
jgi:hypothetical protein